MDEERDYASDTDESDEDFRPDNLAGDESPASEEEEANNDSEVPEENDDNDVGQIATKRNGAAKKVIKKKRSKTKNKQPDSDDDDEDVTKDVDTNTSRRSTRQTENALLNGREKTLEKDELLSDDEDKTRTNALWEDFLKDVNPAASSSKGNNATNTKEKTQDSINKKPVTNSNTAGPVPSREETVKSKVEETKKTTVTEVLDFAGEEVRIEREVDASSIKENKAAVTQPAKKQPFGRIMPGVGTKRAISTSTSSSASGGLGSILNQLGKKKKLSVLEKTQMDWNNFKQTEGIDEQLQTFNKGKDGYLERQDFLQRTDLRQFEIEKNLRQSTRRPL